MESAGTATITLSTLADEFPAAIAGISEPRVLLKCDVQGHDAEVLRGAGAEGLDASVVAVLIELIAQPIYSGQPLMPAVMELLMSDGFTPVAFEPFFESSDGLRVVEFDGVFLRPEGDQPDWGMNRTHRYAAPPVPAQGAGG